MIDAVHRHSGSVVKFAGDSLVAVWTNSDGGAADPPPSTFLTPGKDEQVREFLPTVDPANEEEDEEEDSRDATTAPSQRPPQHPPQQQQRTGFGDIASAFLCCLELLLMVDVLGRDAEDATSPEQRILQGVTVHIGLGCGATNHTHVGTMGDGCEYFVTGQSARDASTMLDMARPNELAIAADCWTVIKHEFTTLCPLAATGALDELVKPSFDDRGCVIIRSEIFASNYARHSLTWLLSMFSGDVLLPPVSPSPSSSSSNLGFSRTTATTTSPATAMRYNEYISGTIVHHLDDALSARELGETTSELRKCAVVFVRLTGTLATLATSGLGLGLSILQYLMTTVLESLDMFDGCLRQFNVDDKGPTLLLVWGVERYSHEEGEAAFALHAALRIARKLEQTYGTGCFSLGVAQGVVFSGVIGSPYRCDHTILGVAVNEAARLMCHPLTDECMVLVTEEIYADCKDQFLFSSSSHSIPVKGTTQPRRVFVPIRPLRTSNNNRDEKARRKKKDSIVGRKREQEVIRNTVAQWSQGGAPTLVIMGKTGTGKSLLGELVAEEAEKVVPGTVVCVGRASETQRYVPFFALSDILTSLFLDLDIKALAQKAEELAREDRDNGGEKRHRTPRYTMPSEDHPPVFKQRRAGETGAPRPSSTQTIPRLALPTQPLSRAARHGKHRSMDALKALSVTAGQQTHADAVAAAAAVAADSARATTDHTLGAASAAAGVVAGDRYGQFGGEGWTLLTKQRAPSDFAVPAGQTQVKPGSEAAASVSTAAVAAVPGAPSQCPFRRRRTRSSPQRPRIPCTRASHDADALVRKAREHEEVDGEALSAKTILFPETSPVAESFPSALTLGNIPKCDNAQRQSLTLDIPAVALTAPPASSSPSSSPETATPPSSPPPPSVTSPLSLTPPTSFRRGSLLPSPDLLAHHTAIDYIAPPFATSANNTTPTATTTTTTTMTSVACHPLCPRRTKLQRDMGAHTLVDAFGSVHLPGCYGTKGKTRLVGMMSKLAERVQSIIHLLGVNHHLLPLLNDVIPTSYPSTPFITNLGSHDRKVHLTNFITNILDVLTVEFEVPVVLVLDNAQWCDSMGTQLFYDVSRRCTRILAVWLTRPKGEYNMESSSYKILERIIVGGVERVNPVPPGDDGAAAAGMKKKKHRGDRAAEPFVAQQRENQNQQRQQQQQHDQSSPTTPRDQEQHQQHQQPSSTKPPIVISETGHAAIPAALLDLSGLSLSETEEMLLTIMRKRYTTAEGVDGRLVAEIFRRTGGNPVMIAMLTSSILERLDGMVVDGVLRIASRAHTASQLDGVLPQDAATVVLAHLDRTEPAMRHVLLVASVAGQHFKLHTLAALLIRNPVKEFAEFGLETPQGRQRLLEYLMEHDRFQFLKFTFEKSPVNKNQQLHHETTTKTEQQQEAAEETPGESDSAWMSSSGYSSEASSIMSESEAETSSSASSIASLSLSTRSGGSGSSYTRRHRHHKKKKDRENDEQTDVTNDNDDATTSNSNSNRVPQTEEYCSEIYFHHYVVYRAIYSTIIPSRRATLHASYAAHYAQTLSQADISLRSGTRDFFVATINLHLDRCRPLVPASTLLRFALDAFNMYASRAIISEAIDAYTRLEHLMKTYPEQAADTMDILARLRVLRLMCDLWLGAIDYHKGWEYFTKAMIHL
ncbi:hypothetical protein DFJ77DRAFT_163786 [Powellomyces hirtus]|nr:hypothetical protein DFJ77DRAFT_163786 [Powellomyces hirtus]